MSRADRCFNFTDALPDTGPYQPGWCGVAISQQIMKNNNTPYQALTQCCTSGQYTLWPETYNRNYPEKCFAYCKTFNQTQLQQVGRCLDANVGSHGCASGGPHAVMLSWSTLLLSVLLMSVMLGQ
ncbi:hypothetical protein N7539_000502 [Penicillium diatomitis]|uniref:Uncharacterized protein n=1 Tax=Penicillium diatomitis TaxID=2819901 RepID=A0A9X0C2E2_9EURO|nr:uncharacterized protein N7539_000502 [Penicillium diatomitis]KAJ5495386.1 hypothetical protein N7539_000502 [Penicillium diatomitis]